MKTRPILCMLFLTFLTLQALPQSYDSLVVENAQWTVMYDDDGTPWDDDMYGWLIRGDTVLNGLEYKKLYSRYFEEPNSNSIVSQELYGYLREDVENKKVYALVTGPGWLGCDTLNDEYILFDFTYLVGDTSYLCSLTEQLGPCEVTEIWNEFLYGKNRNIFYFGGFAAGFIEGIGHEFGLMESPVWNISGGVNTQLYTYCRGTDEECGVVYVEVDEPEQENMISVYPNPASDVVRINFSDKFSNPGNFNVFVYDVYGRLIGEVDVLSEDITIDVSFFEPGLYLIILMEENKVINSKKFSIARHQ